MWGAAERAGLRMSGARQLAMEGVQRDTDELDMTVRGLVKARQGVALSLLLFW